MKRILLLLITITCATAMWSQESRDNFLDEPQKKDKREYHFGADYRVLAGYVQDWQNSTALTYPDLYLHGGKLGFTVDLFLPYDLSFVTGVSYTLTAGQHSQHWRSMNAETTQKEVIEHHITKHTLDIPLHLSYRQKLWKELALVFYGGPQLQFGLYEYDRCVTSLSPATQQWLEDNGVHTTPYNRNGDELMPFNLQISVGGGLEWDSYRLQAGYDFGLINRARQYTNNSQYKPFMREWSWNVCFAYRF